MLVFIGMSCEDPDKAPVLTFDAAGKGAYPRLIEDAGEPFVNLFDVDGSSYSMDVEFVDNEQGKTVQSYDFELEFEDNDASNGDDSGSGIALMSFSEADFSVNENGFVGLTGVTITGPQLLDAAGLSEADVSPGDVFRVTSSVTTSNGVFAQANSSTTIYGAAFRGIFNINLSAGCPSSLGGEYSYTSTYWCGAGAGSGTVEIVDNGGGNYTFSDWSFGGYDDCYGGFGGWGGLSFAEVCSEVGFTGFTDAFGDTWTFVTEVNGNIWSIEWENTYGEFGTVDITFPGGVPFEVE